MIGCLTCMNADGIGAALNFGNEAPELDDLLLNFNGIYITLPFYYTPMTLALRQGIEYRRYFLRQPDPISDLQAVISAIRAAGSFDIHVFASPSSGGAQADYPAAIIECSHEGVALRTAADNQQYEPRLLSDFFLAVTNHHRTLTPPDECPRYAIQVERLNRLETLDIDQAFEIEQEIIQSEGPFNTVQMVGFMPDARQIWIAFGRDGLRAPEVEPVQLSWEEIFE
jgi:hypothetical protein